MADSPVFMWLLLGIVVLGMLSLVLPMLYSKTSRALRFMSLMTCLAYVYMLGVALKFAGFGPDFVRWHLGDIGFPMAIAYLWAKAISSMESRRHPEWKFRQARTSLVMANSALKAAPFAVLISYAYELFTGFAPRSNAPSLVGGFDWIDMVCYTVGGVLIYSVARRHSVFMTNALADYELSRTRMAALKQKRVRLSTAVKAPPPHTESRSAKKRRSKRKRR